MEESNQVGGTHCLETTEGGAYIIRTWKQSDRARGTDFLETTEQGTSQDMERKWPSRGNSHPGDHRGWDESGHGKKVTKQGAPTSWRPQRNGQVRTWKESDQTRGTHIL